MIFAILTTRVGAADSDLDAKREAYWQDHTKHLVARGPFGDHSGELMLLRADNLEQAVELCQADPAVVAGVDRYRLHQWEAECVDLGLLDNDLPSEPSVTSEPLTAPESEDAFQIVDAMRSDEHAETVVRCFAHGQIAEDDPSRATYLANARGRGLRKLLLKYEGDAAGQIEFGPPAASGLPIEGDDTFVINCLWVVNAFTGLDSGRRLLAACAEMAEAEHAQSLCTVAYNSTLSWLPFGFYERQGFAVIDQVETGRYSGSTQVIAYLMWRPLRENAPRPRWNSEQLLSGVSFCPAYPWMFGKQLYWGRDFDYRAILVREGLRRPDIIQRLPTLAEHTSETWNLVEAGIATADLNRAIKLIQSALLDEPTYYAYIYNRSSDEVIIVYPHREYRVTRDEESWEEAIRYGLDKGIPRKDLVFELFE